MEIRYPNLKNKISNLFFAFQIVLTCNSRLFVRKALCSAIQFMEISNKLLCEVQS
jgi:hypothetical protein